MIINSLFIKPESTGLGSVPPKSKFSNSNYLFSDIIKVIGFNDDNLINNSASISKSQEQLSTSYQSATENNQICLNKSDLQTVNSSVASILKQNGTNQTDDPVNFQILVNKIDSLAANSCDFKNVPVSFSLEMAVLTESSWPIKENKKVVLENDSENESNIEKTKKDNLAIQINSTLPVDLTQQNLFLVIPNLSQQFNNSDNLFKVKIEINNNSNSQKAAGISELNYTSNQANSTNNFVPDQHISVLSFFNTTCTPATVNLNSQIKSLGLNENSFSQPENGIIDFNQSGETNNIINSLHNLIPGWLNNRNLFSTKYNNDAMSLSSEKNLDLSAPKLTELKSTDTTGFTTNTIISETIDIRDESKTSDFNESSEYKIAPPIQTDKGSSIKSVDVPVEFNISTNSECKNNQESFAPEEYILQPVNGIIQVTKTADIYTASQPIYLDKNFINGNDLDINENPPLKIFDQNPDTNKDGVSFSENAFSILTTTDKEKFTKISNPYNDDILKTSVINDSVNQQFQYSAGVLQSNTPLEIKISHRPNVKSQRLVVTEKSPTKSSNNSRKMEFNTTDKTTKRFFETSIFENLSEKQENDKYFTFTPRSVTNKKLVEPVVLIDDTSKSDFSDKPHIINAKTNNNDSWNSNSDTVVSTRSKGIGVNQDETLKEINLKITNDTESRNVDSNIQITSPVKVMTFAGKDNVKIPVSILDEPVQSSFLKVKAEDLVKEIHKAFTNDDSRKVILNLQPENLGNVKIEFDIKEKSLNAKISVDTESAKNLIQTNSDALKNSLLDSGITLNSFNVLLSDGQHHQHTPIIKKKIQKNEIIETTSDPVQLERKNLGYNTYEYLA